MLIDMVVVARFKSNLFDDFINEVGNEQVIVVTLRPCFLASDLNRSLNVFRIVRQDFACRCDL